MAARNHLSHLERTREKIKTSMLINRLNEFVEGKIELSGPQVTAALGLIKKVIPDQQAVAHGGSVDVKLVGEVVFRGLNG